MTQLPSHDEDLTAPAVQGVKEDLLDKTVKLDVEDKTGGKSFVSAHIGDEDIDKDTGNIRFDDREVTEFGGDLLNGSLQFLKADVAELMMGNHDIGNSNEKINILGEIEVGLVEDANAINEEGLETDYDPHSKAIVNVGKDEDIEETENCPSNSPMDEEEMDLACKIKRIVEQTLKSDGFKEGKRETIEEVVNSRNKTVLVTDVVDNKSTVNGFNSTALVENKELVDVARQEEEKEGVFDRILKEKKRCSRNWTWVKKRDRGGI